MNPERPVTGLCLFELHFPGSRSLKDKRQPLKSIKDRIRGRLNVSVCEFGDADLWQRTSLALCMVAHHEEPIRAAFDEARQCIESKGQVLIIDQKIEFF